jgi:hypothetical protein
MNRQLMEKAEKQFMSFPGLMEKSLNKPDAEHVPTEKKTRKPKEAVKKEPDVPIPPSAPAKKTGKRKVI